MTSPDPKIAAEMEAAWALRDAEVRGQSAVDTEPHSQWVPAPTSTQEGRAR